MRELQASAFGECARAQIGARVERRAQGGGRKVCSNAHGQGRCFIARWAACAAAILGTSHQTRTPQGAAVPHEDGAPSPHALR